MKKKAPAQIYHYKIGGKKIKLRVDRSDLPKEADLLPLIFYYSCLYCNKDFDSVTQTCPQCSRPLTKVNLKKCDKCGATNKPGRTTCWVCSAPFTMPEVKTDKETVSVLTLEMHDRVYKSTDKDLKDDIKNLFADLMAKGFDKGVFEDWAKRKEFHSEAAREFLQERKSYSERERKHQYRLGIIAVIIIIVIFLVLAWLLRPKGLPPL
ncbi:MAG: hypothetical protein ACM3IL_03805 [Deltaproteobacteria bacterium]